LVSSQPPDLRHNQIQKLKTIEIMTTFQKNYIGKGTRVKNLDIIRVSISRDKLEEIMKSDLVKYDENEYLVFEVAGLKSKDDYGRTHTAYISKKVEDEKPTRKRTKKSN